MFKGKVLEILTTLTGRAFTNFNIFGPEILGRNGGCNNIVRPTSEAALILVKLK